ncbi:uncharacterized protein LOC113513753 [Galleria mellonella]|uniref:Uncharacterized protein LOC113513753 n=1 Tax=Galleria mellonella TaxID=7137 RepID=A0ABM3M9W0_GALME|nr:uncharacterized protein LOC113513753 [Galleria mellonella]XP_052748197.1 uncharacterized protein LOC113513753 [Galleria mellonella]
MDSGTAEASGSGSELEYTTGVRLVVLNLPEDEGEGLGFRLTRTLWDPYPWVREVTPGARADVAGLKTGDCLLQADGKDLLGLPVGQVAGLIRGDGAGHGVSLLVWNCGVDPKDDPELLWSCGGGARGERSRRALAGVVRALACCVCAATAARALSCARSHLYCEPCWTRLERCALCRETLPPKDSPYAKNLVAEQVFEAIATEYEIKDTHKKPKASVSAYNSPNRSPNISPAVSRKGQYRLTAMNRKKTVHFNDKFGQNYSSDPNIHRSLHTQDFKQQNFSNFQQSTTCAENSTNLHSKSQPGNSGCGCQKNQIQNDVPKMTDSTSNNAQCVEAKECHAHCQNLQHKLVAKLRQACSLADLQNIAVQSCALSRSLNNLGECKGHTHHSNSLDNLKSSGVNVPDTPVFVLSAPPIYVLTCDHNQDK